MSIVSIKIAPAHKTAIEAALHAVNGAAAKHAYTTFGEIEFLSKNAEDKLASLKLPLTLRPGAVWVETSGAAVANAYDNKRMGTRITLTRKAAGWVLTGVERVTLYKEGGGAGKLALTRKQFDEAAKRLLAGIQIMESADTVIAA